MIFCRMSQNEEGTKTALLLGMVFSNEKDPRTGQMYRDKVRCEAMEQIGYVVKTLDNKHNGDLQRVREIIIVRSKAIQRNALQSNAMQFNGIHPNAIFMYIVYVQHLFSDM